MVNGPVEKESKTIYKIKIMEKIKILGISGSLRKGSFNTALLRAAAETVPADVEIEIADISELPLFNQDLEMDMPESAKKLKEKIEASDAILFATPEYNYSVPGVLKNAIDWAARPYGKNSFDGKPAAIMSSSVGMISGARAQYHLRQMFVFLNMHAINQPEMMVSMVQEKIDANGKITDPKTKEKIGELVAALAEWTRQLKK